jgi:PAS domain S-box-containing protein
MNTQYVSDSIYSILGYNKNVFEEGSLSYFDCIHNLDLDRVLSELKDHNSVQHEPYRVITKDGNIKWVMAYTVLLRDNKGNITHYLGNIIDITEQRKREKIIEDQAKLAAMGEMIGNIAHQWRQPLSEISIHSTGLLVQSELGQKISESIIQEKMEIINNNAQFLSKTIDTFRDFIKGESNKEEFSIFELLNETQPLFQSSLKNNHISFFNNIDENFNEKVCLDKNQFSQVVINIINNSKDAIIDNKADKGWIKIESDVKNDTVIISIEDNGGGIPEDIIYHIFDPYFTTKHKSQGTGLGLHMSYKIITESMNGSIYVENTLSGAKFFIVLPLYS